MQLTSQTGVQSVTGTVITGKGFKDMAEGMGGEQQEVNEKTKKKAILVGIAFAMVGIGLVLSIVGAVSGGQRQAVGILAAIALALIVLQMVVKFPMGKEIFDDEGSDDPMMAGMEASMKEMFKVSYQAGIFVALGALAVPIFVMFAAGGKPPE